MPSNARYDRILLDGPLHRRRVLLGIAEGRPAAVVRPLSMKEGRKLQRITRTSKDPVRLRRAIVVMMSGQGQTVPDITGLLQVSDDYVRYVIHAFNEQQAWTPPLRQSRPGGHCCHGGG